jgi:hypothetical protein
MSRQERETRETVERETVDTSPHPETTTYRPETARTYPETTTTTVPEATAGYRERVEGPVTWEEMRALLRREPAVYERTWKPTTGGILAIIAGAINLILGAAAVFGIGFLEDLSTTLNLSDTVAISAGAPFMVLGIISIIGGILAIMRRAFPFALIGSIATLFGIVLLLPFIMGVLSTIFVSLGHPEFKGARRDVYTRDDYRR